MNDDSDYHSIEEDDCANDNRVTFKQFNASYVKPTYWDYLKFRCRLPSISKAYAWSHFSMSDGPLTEDEYQRFMTLTDDMEWNRKNADSIARLRARTTFGYYLMDWFRMFVPISFQEFKNIHSDMAYQEWAWKNDEL